MVPRQNQDVFRVVLLQKVQILIDGVGGALVPAALLVLLNIGGEHMDPAVGHVQVPGQAGAYVCVQLLGFVLGQYAHGVNARVDAVGKGEVDDAVFAPKGDGRFGHLTGQGLQPAALAAGQQHGNTFLFHVSITSMIDKSGETTVTSRQVSGLLHGGEGRRESGMCAPPSDKRRLTFSSLFLRPSLPGLSSSPPRRPWACGWGSFWRSAG